jgi:hypothetical protein
LAEKENIGEVLAIHREGLVEPLMLIRPRPGGRGGDWGKDALRTLGIPPVEKIMYSYESDEPSSSLIVFNLKSTDVTLCRPGRPSSATVPSSYIVLYEEISYLSKLKFDLDLIEEGLVAQSKLGSVVD